MASETTFKSPGFFENEIDLSGRTVDITGVPAGVIGTAEFGPAFVPVTVGSFADFVNKFGSLDPTRFGPYAVNEFLKHRTALTYIRVLGAGANSTIGDISNFESQGTVKSAGFKIKATTPAPSPANTKDGRSAGAVQFICAIHNVSASGETYGYPVFSDNNSYPNLSAGSPTVPLVRGMVFTTTGSRMMVMSGQDSILSGSVYDSSLSLLDQDYAAPGGSGPAAGLDTSAPMYEKFKLIISSSEGADFYTDEGNAGIRIITASLDPADDAYIANVLNTDPERFQEERHLLYAHFPVEKELANLDIHPAGMTGSIGLLSGSISTSAGTDSTNAFLDLFGRFDTRYSPARTTSFISQPFGTKEYDLFHFETISDGDVTNTLYKISVTDLRRSSDKTDQYGTFSVMVRSFGDTDTNPQVLEQYAKCTLNPSSDDYVARKIGDYKVRYNFDATSVSERRFVITGKYPNNSSRVRIVMNTAVDETGDVPATALPFGFRGLPSLKTTDSLTAGVTPLSPTVGNNTATAVVGANTNSRLAGTFYTGDEEDTQSPGANVVTASIVPPVPLRFKLTRGSVLAASVTYTGEPGNSEIVDGRYHWGVKFERMPRTGTKDDAILNVNASSEANELISNYAKLLGITKLDTLTTGSGADEFNNNKFTLARVALGNRHKQFNADKTTGDSLLTSVTGTVTGTASEHMLEAAYIRNGKIDPENAWIKDGSHKRLTLASLAILTSSVYFNKFSSYAKFTNMFYGGFDGVNILDRDMARMNDRASSSETGGKAAGSDIGLHSGFDPGEGEDNNTVASYRAAAKIMTDPMVTRVNIVSIPDIRDPSVTDYVSERTRDYKQAIYLMDIPSVNDDQERIFDNVFPPTNYRPDVERTVDAFEARAFDNNYVATYFPDVSIEDTANNRPVTVPASVAAIGALAYNDSVAYPWFAPAGFNRAALDFVVGVRTRLSSGDRDDLYEARINPIATFPTAGYVIFGQKTLQMARSALDRVNVRRMLLEVKRIVVDIANKLVFEANTPETRANFVGQVTPQLALIQSQQGVDKFKVVMDETNNSTTDIESNRLNGTVTIVPTRAVEFISVDFIITHAGVEFD